MLESAGLAILAFLVLLSMGMPIGFTMLLVGFLGLYLTRGGQVAYATLGLAPYSAAANAMLIVIPLFILSGQIAFASGISNDAYETAYRWLGKLKGGLAMATVAACAAFAATSGSSVATAATVGKIAIPQMRRFGYSDVFATGTVAAGGLLGIMIPPSITMVIYGIVTETSIGKLLISGVVPGILTALIFCLGIGVVAHFRPQMAPPGPSFSWKERFGSLYKGWGIIALFLVICGGIYTGIFTASEAAAAGAFFALLLAIVRRTSLRALYESFGEGARTTAMIFMVLVGAAVFNQFITITGTATVISQFIGGLPLGKFGILALILFFYLPLGMFLDPISIMLVTLPITFAIVVKGLGFDAIWYGVIITKMMEIANITPPVGFNVYIIKGIAPEVPLYRIFQGAGMFVALELITLVILVLFPEISIWLPSQVAR